MAASQTRPFQLGMPRIGIAGRPPEVSSGRGIHDAGDARGSYRNGSGELEAIAVIGTIGAGGTRMPFGHLTGGACGRGRAINDSQQVAVRGALPHGERL
ncbi:MAG: hypothetical protein JNL62_02385 [Bryobacterales bacterium]|nr:hypothetical protein [Bryobacterales bacterium]